MYQNDSQTCHALQVVEVTQSGEFYKVFLLTLFLSFLIYNSFHISDSFQFRFYLLSICQDFAAAPRDRDY